MANWWEPTAVNYLRQVPKALILDAVGEAVSAEAAAPLAKLKKDELVAAAEALMAGKGWLPTVLRPRMESETSGRTRLKVASSMSA
jgi:ParB family transcriptional regulator, chromosome partitioning protein